jgi:hypothetical protein
VLGCNRSSRASMATPSYQQYATLTGLMSLYLCAVVYLGPGKMAPQAG